MSSIISLAPLKKFFQYIWFKKPMENVILTDEMWEVLFEDDGSHYETKTVSGVVTQVRESQNLAIIDKEIYMDMSVPVLGGRNIRVGDCLLMVVKRRLESDAWRVERVEMINRNNKNDFSDWGSGPEIILDGVHIPDHFNSKIIVGRITDLSSGKVTINDGELTFDESKADGIKLIVGDWLSLSVAYDPEDSHKHYECVRVEPLRMWNLEGRITLWNGEMGVIEDEIHFQKSLCTAE